MFVVHKLDESHGFTIQLLDDVVSTQYTRDRRTDGQQMTTPGYAHASRGKK